LFTLELVALTSFLLAYLLTPVVRNWFLRIGWVDRPDGNRKIHVEPIPRAGGIAIVLAYMGAYALLAAVRLHGWTATQLNLDLICSVLPGVALVFLMGLLDDKRGVSPWIKLCVQVAAAVIVFIGGLHVEIFHWIPWEKWTWSLPLTVFWLVLCTNAFNLIDGMDGLSTGLGLFATVTLICAAAIHHNYPLLLATVPLAGALLGFLPFNSNPASIFLGDCGSYSVGFLLGCFGIVWSQKSATFLGLTAPLLCLAVPLVDLALAIARRFLGAKSIFSSDRHHIHHRLLDRGLTPRRVVLILYGAAALAAALSLLSTMVRDIYAAFVLLPFFCAAWLGIRTLRYAALQFIDPIALWGKFRQIVRSETIVQNARRTLDVAITPHARWEVLSTTAAQLGFCHVGMTLDGVKFFKSFDTSDATPAWVVTIPLTGGGRVELAHRFESAEGTVISVAPLAEVLRTVLAPVRSSNPAPGHDGQEVEGVHSLPHAAVGRAAS
jgi:UDP-GlcNAc:undecaprenyl-phosphate GlcNAc-1-phosphate transferase